MAGAEAAGGRTPPGPNGRAIRACDHRLRRRILRLLEQPSPLSPTAMARLLEEPVGRVGYHLKLLEQLGAAKLVRERPVRGVVEHFYASLIGEDELARAMLDATEKEDDAD